MASELSAIETSAGYNLYRTTTISLAGNDKDLYRDLEFFLQSFLNISKNVGFYCSFDTVRLYTIYYM